jgi:hypothetical protein
MPPSISCRVVTLGGLFKEAEQFVIPPYQRNYAWGEKQYGAFWNDLARTFQDGAQNCFLGAVVLKAESEGAQGRALTVIDGQQRLTTVAILASALRHFMIGRGAPALAARVERAFLNGGRDADGNLLPRLRLNAANNAVFRDHILDRPDLAAMHELRKGKSASNTNALLLSCFVYMHKRIEELAAAASGVEEAAAMLLRSLAERMTLIDIGVKDDYDAMMLFERLNERGLDLSQIDIIKNFVLMTARPLSHRAQGAWLDIEDQLRSVSLAVFARQHWSSFGKPVEEKQLLSALKAKVSNSRDALAYIDSLARAAPRYAAMSNPAHAYWGAYPAELRASISREIAALGHLGLQQPYVPLLAALEICETDDREHRHLPPLIAMLTAFSFRYATICARPSGSLAAAYARVAAMIRAESCLDPDAIFNAQLRQLYPPDETFALQFRTKTSQDNAACRHILSRINAAVDPDNGGDADPAAYSIDHILPQNPGPAWLKMRRHYRPNFRAHVYRLGNMALLTPSENQRAGNAAFAEKRLVYAGHALAVNRQIAEAEIWTPREIDKRQRWLAALAVRIWRCD